MRVFSPLFLVVTLAFLPACNPGTVSGNGDGEFSIDSYPALVTSSPIPISGIKPAGHGVQVDGVDRVAPGSATTWQVNLDLVEGANAFVFRPVDPQGVEGQELPVSVTLDTIAPTLLSQLPVPDAVDVPLNTLIEVVFSEPVDCATVTPGVFSVVGVTSTIDCQAGIPSVSLVPAADLASNTPYTVTLFSDVTDLAGNQLASDVIWDFTTGDQVVTTPPDPPTLQPPAHPYNLEASVTLGGGKDAGASVLSNGTEVVPRDPTVAWSHTFALAPGTNTFQLTSEGQTGLVSTTSTDFTITRANGNLGVDAPPALSNLNPVPLTGTKPEGYAVHVGGTPVVAADPAMTWAAQVGLVEGPNTLTFESVDPTGLAAESLDVQITLDTTGPLPPTIDNPAPPVFSLNPSVLVGGWKEAGSSVLDSGVEIVPADANDFWSYTFALAVGDNTFSLTSEDALGNASATSTDFSVNRPAGGFTIDPYPPLTNTNPITVTGTKPTGYGVQVDGAIQVPADPAATWSLDLTLAEGPNQFDLAPVDPVGQPGPIQQVAITLDTIGPSVTSRNPDNGVTDVPVNTSVQVGLDEPIDCATVSAANVYLTGITATVGCNSVAASITLTPTANMPALTPITATVEASVSDLAGNPMGAAVVWTFTTGAAPDTTPPDPPTVDNPAPLQYTLNPTIVVGGWKEAGSSVLEGGVEIVPKDPLATWSYAFPLVIGPNAFDLTSEDAAGNLSLTSTAFSVTRPDGSLSIDPYPGLVNATPQPMTGSKPEGYSVWVAGAEVVAASPAMTWNYDLPLAEGINGITFEARDPVGLVGATDSVSIELDTIPPLPPTADNPAPPASTQAATVLVGGWKEADSSVLEGGLEIVPADATTSWQFNFPLVMGANAFALTSTDAAGNTSVTATNFSVTRNSPVGQPTVQFVSPTTVGNQVIRGTKPANTGIWSQGVELVPLDGNTNWDALVNLSPGNNHWELVSRDGGAQESAPPVMVDIDYSPPGQVAAGGQLKIELVLQDIWNYIGDELHAGAAGNDINIFAFDIWIEGPITPGEQCIYDQPSKQRKYTRYVSTLIHGGGQGWNPGPPNPCGGWWGEPDFRTPNYLAALAESGQWAGAGAPLVPTVQRRDPATGMRWPGTHVNGWPDHPELFYRFLGGGGTWFARPKMQQTPYVDGMTEASIRSNQGPSSGPPLGTWSNSRTYTWNLTDKNGVRVEQGPYLVNVTINADRGGPAVPQHYAQFNELDQETCWDDPSVEDFGAHRVEGIIDLNGPGSSLYLREEGAGLVDSCRSIHDPANNYVDCNCPGGAPWPCPNEPISDPTKVGGPIEFLVPDAFFNPGDGSSYAAKITYCPGAPCP